MCLAQDLLADTSVDEVDLDQVDLAPAEQLRQFVVDLVDLLALEVIAELDEFLATAPDLDYVTFAGSGEPTLHSGIGEIISFIKDRYPCYRVAVLTNSALFTDPGVRAALMRADLVVPSLDAVSEEVFVKINRPSPGITAGQVLEGLLDFAREYTGEVWLEIFIVPGVNDTDKELRLLKDAVTAINPDRVQVNTLDRPGAEDWVRPAAPEAIERIAADMVVDKAADNVRYMEIRWAPLLHTRRGLTGRHPADRVQERAAAARYRQVAGRGGGASRSAAGRDGHGPGHRG